MPNLRVYVKIFPIIIFNVINNMFQPKSCVLVDQYHQARISDFSCANFEELPDPEQVKRSLNHNIGWMPPEMFSYVFRKAELETDSRKVDVYSFGIIIYEVRSFHPLPVQFP